MTNTKNKIRLFMRNITFIVSDAENQINENQASFIVSPSLVIIAAIDHWQLINIIPDNQQASWAG